MPICAISKEKRFEREVGWGWGEGWEGHCRWAGSGGWCCGLWAAGARLAGYWGAEVVGVWGRWGAGAARVWGQEGWGLGPGGWVVGAGVRKAVAGIGGGGAGVWGLRAGLRQG